MKETLFIISNGIVLWCEILHEKDDEIGFRVINGNWYGTLRNGFLEADFIDEPVKVRYIKETVPLGHSSDYDNAIEWFRKKYENFLLTGDKQYGRLNSSKQT